MASVESTSSKDGSGMHAAIEYADAKIWCQGIDERRPKVGDDLVVLGKNQRRPPRQRHNPG